MTVMIMDGNYHYHDDDDDDDDEKDAAVVRFPNPLDIGSGLGERTPKKVGFQL